MTQPRQPEVEGARLDELLRSQSLPIAQPTNAEWASKLEKTMQRVRAMPAASHEQDAPDRDVEDVLATPLPVEAGEPEPSDPYAFEAEQAAAYDVLRAPLKSGEHAPLRLTDQGARNAPVARVSDTSENRPLAPRGRLFFIAAAIGSLAAAAAAMIALRQPTDDSASGPVAKVQEAPAQAVVPPEPAASVAVAATPQTEDLPRAETPALAQPLSASQQKSRPATPLAVAAKAAAAPEEPELVPAAGPSSLADHPSTGAISAALSRRIPEAQRCLPATVQSTGAHLTFQSNGTVQKVELQNPALDPSARACLARALGAVRVEPFARAQFDVNATISQPAAKNPGAN